MFLATALLLALALFLLAFAKNELLLLQLGEAEAPKSGFAIALASFLLAAVLLVAAIQVGDPSSDLHDLLATYSKSR